MNAHALLEAITTRGAVVTLNGDRLRVRGDGLLTNELREELRRLKPELLRLLAAPDSESSTRSAPDFAAAFRRVRCNLPIHAARWTDEEKREYSIAVAALDCEIDPRDVGADLLCLISGTPQKAETR